MQLLERESALASLAEYAASAAAREGRLVLVSGEAGAGKTALVESLAAGHPDVPWLVGACDGLFTPRPLGPLFDVAEQLGGDLLDACRRDATREELFRLLRSRLSDVQPWCALVVEDVHWADESTLDLVRFLGRRIRELPVLLLVTYRDDELAVDHPLRQVLGELTSVRSTRRLDLGPLSAEAVATMAAGSTVDPGDLHRLSGGNPFFVTEVLRATDGRMPATARDAVLARLGRLTTEARRVAELAALDGTHVDAALLDRVVGPADDALDALLASGLLVSDGVDLRFRHEISRLAVEQDIPAHRRKDLHVRVLAALVESGCQDDARLAYHAEGADDAGGVLRYAPAAARRASALGAHREAAAQYERALRFVGADDPAATADLCQRLADEHAHTDTWERATEAGERALSLWREVGDRSREGAVLCQLALSSWRLCRPEEETLRHAAAAVEVLEPRGPSPELAWAYAIAAKTELMTSRRDGPHALVLARRAQQLAESLGPPDALSDALVTEACLVADDGVDWLSLMRRALDISGAADAQYQVGRAYGNIVEQLVQRRRFAEAWSYLEAGTRYCDDHDLGTHGNLLHALGIALLVRQGRWDDAVRTARPLLAGRVSARPNRTHLTTHAGIVLARRGDPAATGYLDEAVGNAAMSGYGYWVVKAYPARAEAHWLAGDLDAARADLAVAAAAIPTAPRDVAASIAAWCRRLGLDVAAVDPAPDDPTGHLLAGDAAAATRGWDELGMPYDAALACYDTGNEDGLRAAVRRFEALGASAAVKATQREMRRLGLRSIPAGSRATTRAHPLGLTRREAEVLELVCAGRTNSEISAELVLSPHTVDHHVSSVLAKLGVGTRQEAARLAVSRGLAGRRSG